MIEPGAARGKQLPWCIEADGVGMARHDDAIRLDAPGQLLPMSGAGLDHDGLFYALFHKKGA